MNKLRVLVSLVKGYGLGDAVQMSAVLRHVRKYRPHWEIDWQAEPGRESIGRGIAHRVFTYGNGPSSTYDAEVQIVLYDTFANWSDRPNTRVTSCLHERFGIQWDASLARYEINVSRDAWYAAAMAMSKWTASLPRLNSHIIAVHTKGDSVPHRKDLSPAQTQRICDKITALGHFPLVLDWRGALASPEWGRDAEMNCAVISQCAAFVGIDSGPGKCASATQTPSLIVWTGHHPALFHDPAPNTTHLVPADYNRLHPVCNDPGVLAFFEANYLVQKYATDPLMEIEAWLTKQLS